jgi:DNA polymerase III subunit beta
MNFTTDPRKLASVVSWAARRVPNKPEQPILGGMLIECDLRSDPNAEQVLFSGFDFEVSTTATLAPSVVRGFEEGDRYVVSGRLFAELVKSLPAKPVTVEVNDEEMRLTCGPVKASLPLMPAEDYPVLPTSPEPIGYVHAEDFAREVARVLPAYDQAGTSGLPTLTGMYLGFRDDHLSIAATNRYQMAVDTVPGWRLNPDAAEAVDFPIVVPGEVVSAVLKVCDYDGPLAIGVADHAVSFGTGQRATVSRLLDVKGFPNFASRIPARAESPTAINVEEVREALKRAAMVLDGPEPVSLSFESDILTMRAGSGRGQVTAELDCDHQGTGIEIVVNPQYFTTAISSTGDTAELTIGGPASPILITAPKDDAYAHVVMPIRRPS